MLTSEKEILDQLSETSRPERLLQARLTNLTWLKQCAKASGEEDLARSIALERSNLERKEKLRLSKEPKTAPACPSTPSLHHKLLDCRSAARYYAMSKADANSIKLVAALKSLSDEMEQSPDCSMNEAAARFQRMVSKSVEQANKRLLFEACDDLRDALRAQGIQVVDNIHGK